MDACRYGIYLLVFASQTTFQIAMREEIIEASLTQNKQQMAIKKYLIDTFTCRGFRLTTCLYIALSINVILPKINWAVH